MGWVLDAGSSGTDALELNLTDDTYYFLREQSTPMPEPEPQWVSRLDGDALTGLRYRNRQITLELDVTAGSASVLEEKIGALQQAVGRVNRDAAANGVGGTLQFTPPSGTNCSYNLLSAQVNFTADVGYYAANFARVALAFECEPFGIGSESLVVQATETSAACLSMVASDVVGDVPALGRLVVDEDDGDDQACVLWGVRSRNYSADATAGLFWQASALTPVAAGAATAAGPSGAYGSGSNTIEADELTTEWQDVLKSTVSSTYWTHVGSYRVIVRVQADAANVGSVEVRGSWGLGDLAVYQQGAAAATAAGSWVLCDLGVVSVPRVIVGTHRWEFRVQARSTVNGEDVFLNWLLLQPVDESAGTAQMTGAGSLRAYTVQDNYTQTAGNLDGKTPSVQNDGSNWAESTAGKFTIDTTNDRAQRTGVSDTADLKNGAFAVASAAMTGTFASVDMRQSAIVAAPSMGVVMRYTNATNWVAAVVTNDGPYFYLQHIKCVSGTTTMIAFATLGATAPYGATFDTNYLTVQSAVMANGFIASVVFFTSWGAAVQLGSLVTMDNALATGGALASGKVGIVDHQTNATACTRSFAAFRAGTVANEAACFANQSIRIAHDGVVREDSAGNVWGNPGKVEGDLLLIPPAGREGRTCQVMVKMSRTPLGAAGDIAADDLSATLYVTPRYLILPS